jgi:membrane associated rhomboid family serine protease
VTLVRRIGAFLESKDDGELGVGGRLARTYRRWTVIVGGFMLLVLLINSGAARTGMDIWKALLGLVVGLLPMWVVSQGLRNDFP